MASIERSKISKHFLISFHKKKQNSKSNANWAEKQETQRNELYANLEKLEQIFLS